MQLLPVSAGHGGLEPANPPACGQPEAHNSAYAPAAVIQIETICSTSFETTLFRSAFTLAFYGAFRSSELLAASRTDLHGPALACNDVQVQGSQLCITLR